MGYLYPVAHVCGGQNKIMNNSQFKLCDLLLKINLLHAKTLYTTHHMHIVATTDDERLKYPGRV